MKPHLIVAITCLTLVFSVDNVVTDIWPNIACKGYSESSTFIESPLNAEKVCAYVEGDKVYLNPDVQWAGDEVCSIINIYDWLYTQVTNTTAPQTLVCSTEHVVDLDSIDEDDKTDCITARNYSHIFATQNLTEEEYADLDFDELSTDSDFNADGLKFCDTDEDCILLNPNITGSSCACAMSGTSYCYPMSGSSYMKDQYQECKDKNKEMDSYKYVYYLYKRAYGIFYEGRPECADDVIAEFEILNRMDKWDFGLLLLPAVILLVN